MKKVLLMIISIQFILFLFFFFPAQAIYAVTDNALNPTLSHQGGFYTEAIDLTINAKPNTQVFYTLDGSKPTASSSVYQAPIHIEEHSILADGSSYVIEEDTHLSQLPLSMIKTSEKLWFSPTEDVFKATVVKIIAIELDTNRKSDVITNTYFVAPDMDTKYTFPIISLATNIENLYSYEMGIQIQGAKFDSSLSVEGKSNRSGNYAQTGDTWEREVSVELYETSGERSINQHAGIRIHGGLSRTYPIKSYRLYARDTYDEMNTFDYPFFEHKPVERFKRIILRNGGQGYQYTFFGDAFLHHLLEPLDLDIQYNKPIILFINGEYFGIRNIRDRYDTDYLRYHYDINERQVTILSGHAYLEDGSPVGQIHYQRAYQYAIYRNLAKTKVFDRMERWIDMDNLIDYMIAELYTGNVDWPQNNILYWRKNVSYNPNAPYGHDGRWRFMVNDLDASFGVSWGTISPSSNPFDRITGENWKTGRLFVNLLENDRFKARFTYRMIELMDTIFNRDDVIEKLHEWTELYRPEMEDHIARYNHPSSISAWISYINRMENFALHRSSYMLSFLEEYLALDVKHPLEVIYDDDQGDVHINGIETNLGYHQNEYYEGLPIEMIATPKDQYHFEGWYYEDILLTKDTQMIIRPELALNIEARFALGAGEEQPNTNPFMILKIIFILMTLSSTGTLIYLLIDKRRKLQQQVS